jgi:hypothetical protein
MAVRQVPAWQLQRVLTQECREGHSRAGFSALRVLARPLRQQQEENEDCDCQYCRRDWTAQFEPTFRDRLVEEVTDGRSERPSKNERGPEQSNMADAA